MQEILDLLNNIIGEGRDMLLFDEYQVTSAMLRVLGYDTNRLMYGKLDSVEVIVKYAILGAVGLTPRIASLREELMEDLSERHRALHQALLNGHFGVFDVTQIPRLGELSAVDSTSESRTPFFLDNAIRTNETAMSFRRNLARGVVGWIFEDRGLSLLVSLGQLDNDGAALIEEASQQWPRDGRRESTEVVRDILSALVDPTYSYRRSRSRGVRGVRRSLYNATDDEQRWFWQRIGGTLVNELRTATDDPIALRRRSGKIKRLRWIREWMALSSPGGAPAEKEQMADLVDFVRRLRDERVGLMIQRYDFNARVDSKICEQKLSLATVLGAFGLRPDGTLIHFDEEKLARQPASLLLLDDDHPLWAALPRAAPIAAARQWAADTPLKESSAATEVETAWHRLTVEKRWLATFFAPDKEAELVTPSQPWYDELLHAFTTIYDGAILDTPLDGLGLTTPGTVVRISKTLRGLELEVPDDGRFRVRDLPSREEDILAAKGYGGITHRRLVDRLGLLAREWRVRRCGIDPATLDAAPAEGKGAVLLKEGLNELAAFFEVE